MTTFHVVRHGQSLANAAGVLQGQTVDVGLTALGYRQAADVAARLARQSLDAVYSSDLVRALQTAASIATAHRLAVRRCRGLRERGYGVLEGMASDEAMASAGDLDWADPDARPVGGESTRDVYTRVGDVLMLLARRHPHGSVALVSHGDTIRVLVARARHIGAESVPWCEVANGSVTYVNFPPPG